MYFVTSNKTLVFSNKNFRLQRQKSSSSATKIVLCALGFTDMLLIKDMYCQRIAKTHHNLYWPI